MRLFSPPKNIQQFEVNLCLKNCRSFRLLSRKVLKLTRVLKSQQGKDRFVHFLRHISPIIVAIIIIIAVIISGNEKIPVRDKLCSLQVDQAVMRPLIKIKDKIQSSTHKRRYYFYCVRISKKIMNHLIKLIFKVVTVRPSVQHN